MEQQKSVCGGPTIPVTDSLCCGMICHMIMNHAHLDGSCPTSIREPNHELLAFFKKVIALRQQTEVFASRRVSMGRR